MDILAQLFCKQSQMSKDPLLSRTVVVQSHSLGQWLKLRLAEQQGIAANIECILPAAYIWRSYQTLLPRIDLPNESPFDRERLTWRSERPARDSSPAAPRGRRARRVGPCTAPPRA